MNRALAIGVAVGAGVGLGITAAVIVGRGRRRDGAPIARAPADEVPKDEGLGCPALEPRGVAEGIAYRSYTPESPGPHPIILMHGRGGSEDIMFGELADTVLPAVQVYPRGPLELGKYFAWAKARSTDPEWPEQQAAAVERMRPFVAWVSRCLGPPVVAGHSQGAHMAFGMAAAYPELLHAAVGASGALTPALWRRPGVPVVAVHGVEDGVVPVANARRMRDELGVELVEVPGAGHGLGGALEQAFGDALRRLA